jgi:hypothetical protein
MRVILAVLATAPVLSGVSARPTWRRGRAGDASRAGRPGCRQGAPVIGASTTLVALQPLPERAERGVQGPQIRVAQRGQRARVRH